MQLTVIFILIYFVQDTFLPHVEAGTIILIGATTENPSFQVNNALMSRCRVIVLEKLSSECILKILNRALNKLEVKVKSNSDKHIKENADIDRL